MAVKLYFPYKGIHQRELYKEYRLSFVNWSQVLLQLLSLDGRYSGLLQQTLHAYGPLQVRTSSGLDIPKEYESVLSRTRFFI